MEIQPLNYYIDQYLDGTLNAEEWAVLQLMLENPTHIATLEQIMDQQLHLRTTAGEDYPKVIERLKQDFHKKIQDNQGSTVVFHSLFSRNGWFRIAAAILLLFGMGAYFYISHPLGRDLVQMIPNPVVPDILPGSDKAVLTLSNGRKIVLDSSADNMIEEGSVAIKNTKGHLVYNRSELSVNNTMTTPKGGQYRLTLSDGTEVWLNAASSITYPTAFKEEERSVLIEGEAYFEVAKNARQPFVVRTPKDTITVLGTSFNVNVYADEPQMKTSLIEGSVKIRNIILKPGEAFVNERISVTNITKDIAWKNGVFNFHQVKLPDAMRQLARWYDITVQYNGDMTQVELGGEIGRDLSLQQVLRGLEGMDVHFLLKDKMLTVTK